MIQKGFKQNYDPLIVERRRSNLLEQQRQRRLQIQDDQRAMKPMATTVSDLKLRQKNAAYTLKESYGLDLSLQFSEWLLWPPADLSEWLLVACPRGQRCLVLAHRGRSEMYNKRGRRVCVFRSKLPGDATAQTTFTLLDCIYDGKMDVLHVLDALYFRKQELLHGSAEFRRFWLHSQFDEERAAYSERSAHNEKPLLLLPSYDCGNKEQLAAALQRFPHFPNNQPELDGYLFFHKEAQYTCGSTPLVGWLFAFMVPDLLGYEVNSQYVRPPDYQTPMQYISAFDAKLAAKANRRAQAAISQPPNNGSIKILQRKRHHAWHADIDTELVETHNTQNDLGNSEVTAEKALEICDLSSEEAIAGEKANIINRVLANMHLGP